MKKKTVIDTAKVPAQRNLYKVPKKQWAKWSNLERRVFNDLFYQMTTNGPRLFTHPETPRITHRQWRTTAWNAAWMAADNIRAARKVFGHA